MMLAALQDARFDLVEFLSFVLRWTYFDRRTFLSVPDEHRLRFLRGC